ncbi:MAG: hypothetical protein JEZ09_06055 [Salinivirgaceae bacterium]|nr:hypothetical protein [Salinivirgaceae bacterium]
MVFSVQNWLAKHSKDEVLFLFKGVVSGSLITDSLDKIEENIENASSRAKKKIYNVLVECLQNLFHHSLTVKENDDGVEQGKFAICLLTKNQIGYHIIAGNFVNQKQKDFLSKHLENINSLNNEELKDLYKEILNNQEFSDKGGGGLGMVDMARKSGSKLDFEFHNYTKEYYFFSLIINIVE